MVRHEDREIERRTRVGVAVAVLGVVFGLTPPAFASGEAVPLNTFDVPPGATVTVTFQVTVDGPPLPPGVVAVANQGSLTGTNFAPLDTDDPDDPNSNADPTVTPIDSADLSITKDDGQATATPGDPITYTITVANAGANAAVGATVTDNFPAALTGVTWTCVASPGSSCTAGPVAGDIGDVVTVLAGGVLTYTVNATIDPAATGTLANTATVTPPGSTQDPNLTNNSATDTDTLAAEADLAIDKDNGQTSVTAGEPTTYTISVTNVGPSDASGATVTDTFPPELTGVSWTCSATPGSSCTAGPVAGDINDTVTVLAGGTLTYTATGTLAGDATGTLENTATVAAPAGVTDPDGGNNSSTDSDTIIVQADLGITKDDGVTSVTPGTQVTYTITASNAGPGDVTGATVTDSFPAELTCSWTCVPAGGASCTAGPVAGDINDSVDLPNGDSVTYTAVCDLSDTATGTLENTATVAVPAGASDPNSANDSDTDIDTVRGLDFGDAPDPSLGPPAAYPTLLADDGARHGVGTLFLGAAIDAEADGQPTLLADGDDLAGTDDEDGVTFGALANCEDADLTVTASAAGALDAWVDFNGDGDWADAGEQVFASEPLAAGPNPLTFTVPCDAAGASGTFARFRVSPAGGLAADGVAETGEVEDYRLVIASLDFGDAPDPTYPTLFASDGARHALAGGLLLGSQIDSETDGQPTPTADGDDLAGVDDEDGVTFTSPSFPGQSTTVDVVSSAAGLLNAWVDFNGDGDWADAGEQIFADQALVAGSNSLAFSVPPGTAVPLSTFARFRVSTAGGDGPSGFAGDGEVEDYALDILPAADLSITKVDDADPPPAGANLTYTITVDNLGPSEATGVVVTDNLPAGVTLVATSGCAEDPNAVPTCTLGAIPAAGSASYTIEVSIDPMPPSSISNTASVAGNEFDPVAGNDSDTETTTLDGVAPEVVLLDSNQTTEDGEITSCETVQRPVTQLLVTFSEAVEDSGPADPDSVTNPANFRLVTPGSPGAGFDTTTCAGGTGGDTVIPIDAVTYDSGTFVATLDLNGGAALAAGLYRFLACGSTTIVDLAGNPLDGGGGPGTDFVRTFRADPDNSFDDGHFDTYSPECGLGAWMSTDLGQVEISAQDVDGSPLSGSAHNANPMNGFDLAQCVPLAGQQQVPLSAEVQVAADPGEVVSVTLVCDFLDAPMCGGNSLGQGVVALGFQDTAGDWLSLAGDIQSTAGTASALCGFTVLPPASGGYDAFLDALFLGGNELIFLDGFETGDPSRWSGSLP